MTPIPPQAGQRYDVPIFPSASVKAGSWGIQEFRSFALTRFFSSLAVLAPWRLKSSGRLFSLDTIFLFGVLFALPNRLLASS
jgi:hypothetical protein